MIILNLFIHLSLTVCGPPTNVAMQVTQHFIQKINFHFAIHMDILSFLVVSRTRHIGNVCSNGLNFIHEFITNMTIFLQSEMFWISQLQLVTPNPTVCVNTKWLLLHFMYSNGDNWCDKKVLKTWSRVYSTLHNILKTRWEWILKHSNAHSDVSDL